MWGAPRNTSIPAAPSPPPSPRRTGGSGARFVVCFGCLQESSAKSISVSKVQAWYRRMRRCKRCLCLSVRSAHNHNRMRQRSTGIFFPLQTVSEPGITAWMLSDSTSAEVNASDARSEPSSGNDGTGPDARAEILVGKISPCGKQQLRLSWIEPHRRRTAVHAARSGFTRTHRNSPYW